MYIQYVKSVEVSSLVERGLRRELKMLLLELASLRVLVTEDKVNLHENSGLVRVKQALFESFSHLCSRTCQVRTKHDCPWSVVGEFLAGCLEAILKKFEVATTTVSALLVLHFVLNDEWLVTKLDGMLERRGDGMMRSFGLCHQTLVALNEGFKRFLDFPFADVAEGFSANRSLLGRLGGRPPFRPVLGELLEERCLD